MSHRRLLRRMRFAGAVVLAQNAAALAQILPQDAVPGVIPVYQMARPDFDAPGLALGSFSFLPSLSQTLTYDDNIFASDRLQASDLIGTTSETLSAASQWSRHSLSGRVYSSQQLYRDHDFENANTYGAEASGRLDVSRNAFFDLDGGFVQQPQARDSPEADITALKRPVYNTASGTIGFTLDAGRLENHADIGLVKTSYIQLAEAGRSGTLLRYHDRLSIDTSRFVTVFLDGAYSNEDWLLKGDARDFNTLTGTIGASIKITDEIAGEIGVGVLQQKYRNPAFDTLVTPTVKGNLTWSILPLTSLSATVDRTVTGTESFCAPGQSLAACQLLLGVPTTTPVADQRSVLESVLAEIGIQHEFWHDILGEARLRYERDKFDFRDLVDENYSANLNGRYLINRHLELDVSYIHNIRQANKNILFYNSGPYTENLVSLSLKAAY